MCEWKVFNEEVLCSRAKEAAEAAAAAAAAAAAKEKAARFFIDNVLFEDGNDGAAALFDCISSRKF